MSGAHINAFVHESQEGLTELNNALLDLESDPDDAAAMDSIFRIAHTLKGNAAAMGFDEVSGLAHALEDLLDEVRDGSIPVTTELMDLLFDGVDYLDAMVGEIADEGDTTIDIAGLEAELRSIVDGETPPPGTADEAAANSSAGAEPSETDADTASGGEPEDDGPSSSEQSEEPPSGGPESTEDETDGATAVVPTALEIPEEASAFRARVDLGETSMPGVDAMFVLNAIEDGFADFVTVPDREAVEDGDFEETFTVFVAAADTETVSAGIGALSQVANVEVEPAEQTSGGAGEQFEGATEQSAEPADDHASDAVSDTRKQDDMTPESDTTETNSTTTKSTDRADSTTTKPTDSTDSPTDAKRGSPEKDTNADIASVRVDVSQLDELYNLVEQLVTSRIKLRREMEDAGVDSDNLDELDKITANLQNTAMDMRLIPLSKVVDNFPRVVRDVARETGKDVEFTVTGADIELDRTILTEIRDPLIHILRNAVDHGVEPPEVREDAGKDPTGSVSLTATRERDHVTIEVADDGAGLDADELREKAIEKDVKTRSELELMDDSEVYDLIFHPGFSTAEEVTDVSGRGVGMDVVHTTVKQLDGTVSVDSEPGEGTVVTLRLPVTVAIVKVMFVEVAGTEYGIPVKNIAEVTRAKQVTEVNGDEIIKHDDDIYPVLRLGEVLEEPSAVNGDGMLLRIHEDKRQVALHCDAVLDQEEVVVKPLEGVLSGIPGLSGTAVLGDGDVVAVLDVVTL
ncbi:chemotaxis protein CheA [Halalkalirubrum salinum]|uniref:chemotaxis protein CheA n=1 Tax=Halalkalirubrum salinum TaxID=2563889 RepID=UPI0010FB285C|nr:chemotaxis protein CheA [Halalkalirubrum salinum]